MLLYFWIFFIPHLIQVIYNINPIVLTIKKIKVLTKIYLAELINSIAINFFNLLKKSSMHIY